MQFLKRLKNRFTQGKEIEATPEVLSHVLVRQVSSHGLEIEKILSEANLQLADFKHVQILQQLFIFYYSLFVKFIGAKYPHIYTPDIYTEMTGDKMDYASIFLVQARIALGESDLPEQWKQWGLSKDSFFSIFDPYFRFYCHDEVPQEEVESFQRLVKYLRKLSSQSQSDQDNKDGVYYWAMKLQFQLCKILKILPGDESHNVKVFFLLWLGCQLPLLNEFLRQILLKIRPVVNAG